jgi:branched-subunit amino acid ABC-type transport system permease component
MSADEFQERHERSINVITGVVVLLDAALAWLVATLAVTASTSWPVLAILPFTLLFGLLVGAVIRAVATGPTRRLSIVGRGVVAIAVGAVVGELAALVLFGSTIDRRLDEQTARDALTVPAVAQASADLDQTRGARSALDAAVERARADRDEALVVARCEYNPSPACPQTRITGVPGAGPETRTAKELLADAQREVDNTEAARDRGAPALDSKITNAEQWLAQARTTAIAGANHGLGARWVAMNAYTFSNVGALLLRLFTLVFFALLSLLPLIFKSWRGETTNDRGAAARAERDRAELQADTVIAVKRAEVRAATEILWAEQQLANARLAVEAQTEIDREHHRRRVIEALDGPVRVAAQRASVDAEVAQAELPAAAETTENLPALVESGGDVEPRSGSLIPTIPDVTKAAARWIRPLVPPFVARAVDTTTQPLRAARQVFEEVEEITFLLKRTHKVTVNSEETAEQPRQLGSTVAEAKPLAQTDARSERASLSRMPDDDPSPRLTGREPQVELMEHNAPGELRGADGPRQLPPAE